MFNRCKNNLTNRQAIKGKFLSWYGNTFWVYKFDSLGNYEYTTSGHCCNTTTKGHYIVSNNTLYLTPFPKDQQLDSNFISGRDTLIIKNDSCLLNVPLGYEHNIEDTTQTDFYESKRRDIKQKGYPIIK